MPKLKSMKTPKKSTNGSPIDAVGTYENGDKYPYGLRVDLNADSLKALGKKADDFKPGAKGMLVAEVEVIDVRTPSRKDNKQDSVELQITKLSVVTGSKSKLDEYMGKNNSGPSEGEGEKY